MIAFDAPTLAAAVLIARTVKRLRLPADIAVAAALTKAYPLLSEVKMGSLFMVKMDEDKNNKAEESGVAKWTGHMQNFVMGPIDKYGAALMLSHSVMGLGTVGAFHILLDAGADISSYIAWLGLSESMNDGITTTASAVGGAACINSLTLPIKLAIFTEVVPRVAALMGMKKVKPSTTQEVVLQEGATDEEGSTQVTPHALTPPSTPLELVQMGMQKAVDPYVKPK